MGENMIQDSTIKYCFRELEIFDFSGYRDRFERDIIERGLELGVFNTRGPVSVHRSRMAYTALAKKLGPSIKTYKIFAIDYYGYIKKSVGFIDSLHVQIGVLSGKQIKSIRVPIIHFASIKMEDIAEINQDMLKEFPKFKKTILKLRGFIK